MALFKNVLASPQNIMKAVVVIPILCILVASLATAEQSRNRNDTDDARNVSSETFCVNQRKDAAILLTNITSQELMKPARSGSINYFKYCGELRKYRRDTPVNVQNKMVRRKRSHGAGLPHVNDCYKSKYPTMCDYNPNRIPSHIQMPDCGKCGGQDNRSRPKPKCSTHARGKNVTGYWKPIYITIPLPFKQSDSNVYHLINQSISIGCVCRPK